MIPQMLKEHTVNQNIRREIQEKRKNEAVVAVHSLSNAVVDHLNSKISVAYNNQKRLDIESKRLDNNAASLSRQAEQWASLVDSFARTVKEIGDVRSWAFAIERDMKVITKTLEEADKQDTRID